MDKEARIIEIDRKISELEHNLVLWKTNGVKGEVLAALAGTEIQILLYEKDDLMYGTHNLERLFYESYLDLLEEKPNTHAQRREIEEKLFELKTLDYYIYEGYSRGLSS